MNKITRLTALLLALMMILSTFAAADTAYQVGGMTQEQWNAIVENAQKELFTTDEGDSGKVVEPPIPAVPAPGPYHPYTDGTTIPLTISEEPVASQLTPSGVAVLTNSDAGQWQISINGVWVNITGETGDNLWVTAAMMNGMPTADFRKALEPEDEQTGEYIAFTQTATVEIVAEASATFKLMARADENGGEVETSAETDELSLQAANETNTWLVIVRYQFADGTTAANAYSATLGVGTNFKQEIVNPHVMGYKPQDTVLINPVGAEGVTYTGPTVSVEEDTLGDVLDPGSVNFDITNGSTDVIVTVTYVPTYVPYTVFHSQQNVSDDGYTEVESTTLRGLTGSKVGSEAVAKEYEGFFNLLYDQPEIAADGSTKVDIHYDRKYYLMNFDLSGGYGVEPIYARYGTPIGNVGIPQRAGYTFRGWSLNGSTLVDLPTSIPADHQTYIALWDAGSTTYTVVYWSADLDDGNDKTVPTYSYWGQKTVRSGVEVVLVPSQVGQTHTAASAGIADAGYFTYDAGETAARNAQTVTVAGDGSTVVNVYYSRKVYEIRFIYARERNGSITVATLTTTGAVGAGTWTSVRSIPSVTDSRFTPPKTESIGTGASRYTYYYISIEAEYGANIQDIWPASAIGDVTDTNGNTRYWGSWAAEDGTDYRENDAEHANIVGAYPILSADMIKNPNDPVAQRMTAWWGSQVDSWGAANISQHTYHIYFEALPGQSGDTIEYKSKSYVLVDSSHFTCAHNGSTRVDPFEYAGLACINDTRGEKDNNGNYSNLNEDSDFQKSSTNFHAENNQYCPHRGSEQVPLEHGNYCNSFFYDRIEYPLTYTNYNEQSEPINVKFDAPLISLNPGTPEYPANVAPGSLEFAGWYTTPECYDGTEVNWDGAMPAGPLNVYAKWVPTIHMVRFFLTPEAIEAGNDGIYMPQKTTEDGEISSYGAAAFQIEHNKNIAPEYVSSHLDRDAMIDADPRPPYTFAAWYYLDPDTNKKVYFDPGSPILRDMDLIAEWSSSVPVSYTIRYVTVVEGENGEEVEVEVAVPTTGSTLAGLDITFEAKGGEELNPGYQTGYFPTTKSHTINFKAEQAQTGVEYTFYYTSADEVDYTVYYVTEEQNAAETLVPVELDGKTYYTVHTAKQAETNQAIVTESFVTVPGYMPDAFQKRLILVPGADNKIVFIYTVDDEHAYYQVTHNIQNLDGKTYTQYTASEVIGNIGANATTEYQDDPLTIQGFEFEREEYIVGETPTLGSPDGKLLTADGMQINLYYTRNKYPYKVQYLLENSTTELANSKSGTAYYEVEIHEDAVQIENYEVVSATPQSLKIRIEEGTDPVWNVITFYYREVSATINYIPVGPDNQPLSDAEKQTIGYVDPGSETVGKITGNATGSTATLLGAPKYKFVGWYDNAECSGNPVSTNFAFVPAQPGRETSENGEVIKNGLWGDDATYYAKFVYDVGHLSITKNVVNETGYEPTKTTFDFTVMLRDGNGQPLTGDVTYRVDNAAEQTKTLDDGKFTIELTATKAVSQTVVISNLLNGTTYRVTEADEDGYTPAYVNAAGSIVPGRTVEATVTNTYETGNLTITKNVVGETAPENDAFTFRLTLPAGTFKYMQNGEEKTVANGGTVTLKAGESVTIEGIPADTEYAVAEDEKVKYDTSSIGSTGTIGAGETAAVFTNTYKYGDLKIGKRVEPEENGQKQSFSFTLNLSETENEYTYIITDDKNVPRSTGKIRSGATFELQDEWHILVKDLPHGTTYTVTETQIPGYATYVSVDDVVDETDGNTHISEGEIVAGAERLTRFINVYGLGSINIIKNVVGEGDPVTDFSFVLEFKDEHGEKLDGIFSLVTTYKDEMGVQVTREENVNVGEPITFTLQAGWSALIAGLPEGAQYKITETAHADYTTWVKTNDVSTAADETSYGTQTTEATGTIPETGMKQVVYTNIYQYSHLTIHKTGMQSGESAIFEVKAYSKYSNDQETTFTISVPNGKSVTIGELLIGSGYTITEIGSWSNRYSQAGTVNGTIQPNGSEVTVTNSDKNNKWLHGEDYVHNDFSKPGAYEN